MNRYSIYLVGFWLLTFGLFLNQYRQACELREKLVTAREAVEIMARQHEAQLQALDEMAKTKEDAHNEACAKALRLEEILRGNQSFADMPVPDSLRFAWEDSADTLD